MKKFLISMSAISLALFAPLSTVFADEIYEAEYNDENGTIIVEEQEYDVDMSASDFIIAYSEDGFEVIEGDPDFLGYDGKILSVYDNYFNVETTLNMKSAIESSPGYNNQGSGDNDNPGNPDSPGYNTGEFSDILDASGTVLSSVLDYAGDILGFLISNPFCQIILAISFIGLAVITLRGIVSGSHFRG